MFFLADLDLNLFKNRFIKEENNLLGATPYFLTGLKILLGSSQPRNLQK